ncbi:hypothetical protein EDB89DRAFT_1036650 [Lactarius sanguifluus]|nr:hypothetical protein EDB89DRAFT_1036650 [Lactarius sanguifluus]
MGRGIVYWIFQRPRFCCCLPVRICVIIMALLGFILSGVLSVILWFEVVSADGLTSKERGAFIGGAIVETLFFLISSVGLIGVIVRKQTFLTAYAVGLYVHFLVNLGVAGYLLSVVLHATSKDTVTLCQHAIDNTQAQDQCSSLFNTIRGTYAALASVVLVVELYGAIVATRYVYQVRGEKREARMPRHMRGESTSSGTGRLIPGFVRYDDESGTKLYSPYYYPPIEGQGHARGPSAYSLASADFDGVTPMGLYDPPTAGLPNSKYHEDLDFEDGYKEGEQEEEHGYKDMGHDHIVEPPVSAPEKMPEAVHEEAGALR